MVKSLSRTTRAVRILQVIRVTRRSNSPSQINRYLRVTATNRLRRLQQKHDLVRSSTIKGERSKVISTIMSRLKRHISLKRNTSYTIDIQRRPQRQRLRQPNRPTDTRNGLTRFTMANQRTIRRRHLRLHLTL